MPTMGGKLHGTERLDGGWLKICKFGDVDLMDAPCCILSRKQVRNCGMLREA